MRETGEVKNVTDIEFESYYVKKNGEQGSNRFIGTKFDEVDINTLGQYMNNHQTMELDVYFNVREHEGKRFQTVRIYGIRVVV